MIINAYTDYAKRDRTRFCRAVRATRIIIIINRCVRRALDTLCDGGTCTKTRIEMAKRGGGRAAVRNCYRRRHTSRRARFMTSSISFEVVRIDFKHAAAVKRFGNRTPVSCKLYRTRTMYDIRYTIHVRVAPRLDFLRSCLCRVKGPTESPVQTSTRYICTGCV